MFTSINPHSRIYKGCLPIRRLELVEHVRGSRHQEPHHHHHRWQASARNSRPQGSSTRGQLLRDLSRSSGELLASVRAIWFHLPNHQHGPLRSTTPTTRNWHRLSLQNQTSSPRKSTRHTHCTESRSRCLPGGHRYTRMARRPQVPLASIGAPRQCVTMHRLYTFEDAFKVFDPLDEQGKAWNVYQDMLKLGS